MSDALPIELDLFDLLVCPEAKVPLKWTGTHLVSTDPKTRRKYRVDQGIPVMLIQESEVMAEDEWQRAMDSAGPVGGGVAAVDARQAADAE